MKMGGTGKKNKVFRPVVAIAVVVVVVGLFHESGVYKHTSSLASKVPATGL